MKASIALGFALSVLVAGSAVASPEKANQNGAPVPAQMIVLDSKVASSQSVKPFGSKASGTVLVAENRKEFGSRYQRYD